MNLQPMIDLRNAVKGALVSAYSGVPVFTAELTNISDDDDCNTEEFFTAYFEDFDETGVGENLDNENYQVSMKLFVGYFNESAWKDQSILDSEAGRIREVIMDLPFGGNIKRAGGKYVPPVDGATSGLLLIFDVDFSN